MMFNRAFRYRMAHAAAAAVSVVALLLFIAFPVLASSDNEAVAGKVPQLLTAVSEENSKCHECSLGNAVADAVRISMDTDIAIVCGGDLVKNLLPGEITWAELKAAFAEDRTLAAVSITPRELCVILEAGLSRITLDETTSIDNAASAYDGFPQISGFTIQYDASAPPGERIYKIQMDGKALDREDDTTIMKLAATEHMLDGGYGMPAVHGAVGSDLTLSGAFAMYMRHDMSEYMETGFRVYPMGAQDGSLKTLIPVGIILVVIMIILLGNGQRFKRMYDFER